MNISSTYQTLPEIRRAIFLNREELERLGYLLRRQEQYENGSLRHLQTQDEYACRKHELEELQNLLRQMIKQLVKEQPRKNRRKLFAFLLALFLVVMAQLIAKLLIYRFILHLV